ncbi:hypothetical protein [Candidatus Blastococcus massiliensis]|nr:hypothetical protein [Candidatus Blastococcus massiliensis]
MTDYYIDPGLEAELRYRREVLQNIGRRRPSGGPSWWRRRRQIR